MRKGIQNAQSSLGKKIIFELGKKLQYLTETSGKRTSKHRRKLTKILPGI